jgi:SpoVK/Ycf46/Vps4 family AAA+-type ATPase
MVVGSFLTYYVALKLIQMNEFECPEYTGSLKLNTHEKLVYSNLLYPENIGIDFNDIKGNNTAKTLLDKLVIKPLNNYKNSKINPPNGIILYGPPGTGKTMLVKALCKQMNVSFLLFDQSYIEQKMFGESAKVIKAVFTLANKIKPCVIFIDEIDGIFGERNILDQSFITGIKTQMLTYMDGIISRDPSVFIIGATNRLQSIDPAIKRRMRTHIEIPLPNKDDRKELFRYYLKNNESIDYDKLSDTSIGFSGSDINEMCKIAYYTSDCDVSTDYVMDAIYDCGN